MCSLGIMNLNLLSFCPLTSLWFVQKCKPCLPVFPSQAVLSGHDHSYERFVIQPPQGDMGQTLNPVLYYVNGLGGVNFYAFPTSDKRPPEEGSQFQFTGRPGVQLIEADSETIVFKLVVSHLHAPQLMDCYGGRCFSLFCVPVFPCHMPLHMMTTLLFWTSGEHLLLFTLKLPPCCEPCTPQLSPSQPIKEPRTSTGPVTCPNT